VDRKDPSGTTLAFVVNVVTALDKNNASEVIKNKDTCKSLIAKMIESLNRQSSANGSYSPGTLEPPELRQRIVQSRDYWNSEQRASLQYFQSRVSAAAVEVCQGEIARGRLQKARSKRSRDTSATVEPRNEKRKQRKGQNKAGGSSSAKNKERPRRGEDKWDKPCLNQDCGGIHGLAECPNSSGGKKRENFDKYEADKKERKKIPSLQ